MDSNALSYSVVRSTRARAALLLVGLFLVAFAATH